MKPPPPPSRAQGFDKPSPIQEEAIPLALAGRNILARAKNGTGKTGSFCIPCLEKIDTAKNTIQALILVPTRELALQTAAVLKELGKHLKGLEVVSITGGSPLREDIMRLMGTVHVLVGTPGRILDLASKGAAKLNNASFVALDEADKLLSAGEELATRAIAASSRVTIDLAHCCIAAPTLTPSLFPSWRTRCAEFVVVIEELLRQWLPKKRQILLFSATFPMAVKEFRDKWVPCSSYYYILYYT